MKDMVSAAAGYYLFVLMVCSGCETGKGGSVKQFIPATYERSFEGAFSKGSEQLIIENFSGSTYALLQVANYQRKEGNKLLAPVQEKEELTAVYDESSGTLRETKKGLTISFNPSKKFLLMGTTVYEKVK